ncbi:MAG TPA: peptide deformylase [Cryptosporangiaceae bacterium]|nr:peptide deformylase [Cryptosporangiaceae bacterium]
MSTKPRAGRPRPITLVGEPVLHTPCTAVTAFDESLSALVDDMFASMYAAQGVGLAANQIGVGLRLFVYDCPDDRDERQVGHVVNPSLRELPPEERELDEDEEGCLSVPGQWAPLARPHRAVVEGVDRTGAPVTVEGTGLLARCLQHEVDHLDGYLYIDRLTARERKRVLRDLDRDLSRGM